MNAQFLTTGQVAEVLHISTTSVQKLSENGLFKCWKTSGGHRRISVSSLKKYCADNNIALNLDTPEMVIGVYGSKNFVKIFSDVDIGSTQKIVTFIDYRDVLLYIQSGRLVLLILEADFAGALDCFKIHKTFIQERVKDLNVVAYIDQFVNEPTLHFLYCFMNLTIVQKSDVKDMINLADSSSKRNAL